jgi:hypothetical protein
VAEKLKEHTIPTWLSFSLEDNEGRVEGMPAAGERDEALLDLHVVIEFYSR